MEFRCTIYGCLRNALLGAWLCVKHQAIADANFREEEEPESIAQEAHRIVLGDRQEDYGPPLQDFDRTAALWAPILGCEVTAEQVALCMVQVKVSRLVNTPDHRDSIVDVAGYALTLDLIRQDRGDG